MKPLVFITFISLLTLSIAAEAKVCKKGQPCGNSCISWAKTCRINSITFPEKSINGDQQADLNNRRHKIKQETLFGCELMWGAIVDSILFEESNQQVVEKALLKLKNSSDGNKAIQTTEIHSAIESLLKTIKNDQSLINSLKNNYINTYNQFIPACITETDKLIHAKR
ncbi:hypothetical protein L2712_15255 [Shewanella marisflavi]|uniref:hypothetical protein n=1 Tax=Shewanella marisflavi TaxID=260364 RepID=UPI00200EE7EE|nr:hypothetical protein [Shewanella marisflavi]MCL1043004.1 hypothetical protein [Shewanella marisflavi]